MACADIDSAHAPSKIFSMTVLPMKSKLPRPSSKASELVLHDSGPPAPSTKILSYFQSPCCLWLALDIETHELIPNTALCQGWITGQFGHSCCANESKIQDVRIVQIDWSIGHFDASSDPSTKSLLVKLDGFVISEAAAAQSMASRMQRLWRLALPSLVCSANFSWTLLT